MLLSVVIPARNEKYLRPTINNVLENAQGDTEVIAILDGYKDNATVKACTKRWGDKVTFIQHEEAEGQRQSINEACRLSKAKYMMKLDAHCAVDEGFDVKLAADCEYDWTVIPRMYNLDIETFLPKRHKRTDYMWISYDEPKQFRALYYDKTSTPPKILEETGKLRQPKNDKMIDDTMCCMGPGFFMHMKRFWDLGGCDEGHGGWGQQGIEVALKAWLSGGSLKVNKKTWFAHWFRGGGGPGFPYPASGNAQEKARRYSRDLWLNDKWPLATRKLQWVVDKFDAPGWPEKEGRMEQNDRMQLWHLNYMHTHKGRRYPRWRGVDVLKDPQDLVLYQQVIFENKPDYIVEIGTKRGGSTIFFGDMCELNGHGKVISIDIKAQKQPKHDRVTYMNGDSLDDNVIARVKQIVGDGSVMIVLDGDHSYKQVKKELYAYRHIVTKGQYMVAEDCYSSKGKQTGPGDARDWFLPRFPRFQNKPLADQFLVGCLTKDGWLLRTR